MGELILPTHSHNYIKESNNKQSLFLYYHNGSESDMSEYPRCEIIVKIKRHRTTLEDNLNIVSFFDYNDPITIGIKNMFNSLIEI